MADPFGLFIFFLSISISILFGFFIHKLLYKWLKRNWLAFLLSLLGILPLIMILSGICRLLILRPVSGPVGLGEALGIGIGMAIACILFILLGLILYLATLIVVTIYCWIKYSRAKKK